MVYSYEPRSHVYSYKVVNMTSEWGQTNEWTKTVQEFSKVR
jgi:hypothetical protein